MAKRGRRKKIVSSEEAEFFKVFLPDLHSQQLMIPPDFITHFSRTIRERVILKDTTGGKIWHVSVDQNRDGEFFLKNGWPSFVSHHRLTLGEFLVFKYDKCYSFLVKIYGINGCKRDVFAANHDITTARVKVEEENYAEEEINAAKQQTNSGKIARPPRNRETEVSLDNSSECPFFISNITRPSQYNLLIPGLLFKMHNVHTEPEMVLRDAKGNEWDVQIGTSKDGRVRIGKGFSQFRVDNNLVPPKDRCKFTFGAEKSSRVIRVEVLRHVSPRKKSRC
ncbi:hypothetical protein ABFS83_02G107300 [Erythranthe nasuta]